MAPDVFDGERVLAFDLETTGVSTQYDRIVQLALIGANAEGEAIHYEELVNPRRPIPAGASRVHGIYDHDVRSKGGFSTVADAVAELIEGAIIVGHNVRKFDMAMLEGEYLRLGKRAPKPKAIMDTYELVRRLKIGRPHGLDVAEKGFFINSPEKISSSQPHIEAFDNYNDLENAFIENSIFVK